MESAEGKSARERSRNSEGRNARSLRGDRPIRRRKEDRFDFAPFARNVAQAIARRATTPGLVVGIHGQWGTGKTSVLNLIQRFLERGPGGKHITVIRFNPWWFSASADGLLRAFFGQVIASLPVATKALQKVRPILAKLANALSKVPLLGYEPIAEGVGNLLSRDEPTVEDLREQVERLVVRQRRRFVIIVDDLDRLPREDIYQMFRVVRAVADFSRFTYVMAFDPDIVGRALEHYVPDQGRSYIEKIVQVPFAMPVIEQERLDQVLFEGIDQVLQPIDSERFDKSRWGNTYYGGIRALVRSPRDIARFVDTLSVSYPAMREEVDAIDFVAIEALRVFAPDVHRVVATNPAMFGVGARLLDDPKKDASWHQVYLDRLPGDLADAVKELLMRTFPRLNAVWGNFHYRATEQWRRDRRVCCEEGFGLYFRWAVPSDRLTSAALREIVGGTSEPVGVAIDHYVIGQPLEKLSRFRRLLTDLEPLLPTLPSPVSAMALCRALVDRCDELSALDDPTTKGDLDFSVQWFVERVVHRELRRHPAGGRTDFLLSVCESSPSLAAAFSFLNELRLEHSGHERRAPLPESERLIGVDVLDQCADLLRSRVRYLAQSNALLGQPEAARILVWWTGVDREESQSWATNMVNEDRNLLRLLAAFLRASLVSTMGDRVGRAEAFMWIDDFRALGLDPTGLRDRVAELARTAEGREKVAAVTFVKEVDNPRVRPKYEADGTPE